MVISTKQFRNIGVELLLRRFGRIYFNIEKKAELTMLFNQVRVQPYSFLNWYSTLSYAGVLTVPYENLCLKCSPLINMKAPTEAEKRKFRNNIENIFNLLESCFSEECGIEVKFLESAILALPIIDAYLEDKTNEVYKKLIHCDLAIKKEDWIECVSGLRVIVNDLIYWYYITSSDTVLEENNITHQDLLETLLYSSDYSYFSYMKVVLKK